jgi:multicomponent Na+:H+ antiporter subunit C
MIDMTVNLVYVIVIGVLVTAGVYLMLERSLTRVLVGIVLASNGVNVMFLVASGAMGASPIVGMADPSDMADPVPQALVLTAIVITLGMTSFLLSVAYRSWQLNGHDEVQDDIEDRRIARLAARNAPTVYGGDESSPYGGLDASVDETRDETEEDLHRSDLGSRNEEGAQ